MIDKTIVITRAKGDEKEIADALHELGIRVIHEPLMEIFLHHTERQALEQILLSEPDGIIVTSRHAVRALAILSELRDLPLLCVGSSTARSAESMGFTRVSAASGNAQALVDYIVDGYDSGSRFLYASGKHIRVEIDAMLENYGMKVARMVLYEALAAQQLSDTLLEQLRRGQLSGITFLSQRTAHIFTGLLAKATLQDSVAGLEAFCLSEAVAGPLAGGQWKRIHTAAQPTLASLVQSVNNACHP